MIRVRITRERTGLGGPEFLGEIAITNDGTGSETVGHYHFDLYNKAGALIQQGRVLGFPRKQQGAFRLLAQALQQLYPSTQPGRRRRWPGRRKQSQKAVSP